MLLDHLVPCVAGTCVPIVRRPTCKRLSLRELTPKPPTPPTAQSPLELRPDLIDMFPNQRLLQRPHNRLQAALGTESVELVWVSEPLVVEQELSVLLMTSVRVREVRRRCHESLPSSNRSTFSAMSRASGYSPSRSYEQ